MCFPVLLPTRILPNHATHSKCALGTRPKITAPLRATHSQSVSYDSERFAVAGNLSIWNRQLCGCLYLYESAVQDELGGDR